MTERELLIVRYIALEEPTRQQWERFQHEHDVSTSEMRAAMTKLCLSCRRN